MAFPLAHPAVLPLRRFCPRLLSFPALVIGSLSPDLGYLFGRLNVDEYSHRLAGSLGFCLPAGLLLLLAFLRLRVPMARCLPEPYRQVVWPLCQRPFGPPLILVASLLVGAWTHIFWDSVTHKDGWVVEHWWILQTPLTSLLRHTLKVHHVLWYGSTFAGIVWLGLRCQRWLHAAGGPAALASGRVRAGHALLGAALVLPLSATHHLLQGSPVVFAVGALTVVGLVGLLLRILILR